VQEVKEEEDEEDEEAEMSKLAVVVLRPKHVLKDQSYLH
jgi:hypothetical protein